VHTLTPRNFPPEAQCWPGFRSHPRPIILSVPGNFGIGLTTAATLPPLTRGTSAYDGGVLDEYIGDLNGYTSHNGTTVWVTNANGHDDEDWSCNCRVPYSPRF
jgi:hypothetical protein